VDGRPVAAVEVASTRWARARGLIARPQPQGALWLPCTASVHTVAMGYPIDVACCDRAGVVGTVHHLEPWRLVWPRPGITSVVEAAAGAFDAWGLGPGSQLSVVPPV
jgi:uncharacterized membrane protein (UPF0127 family)